MKLRVACKGSLFYFQKIFKTVSRIIGKSRKICYDSCIVITMNEMKRRIVMKKTTKMLATSLLVAVGLAACGSNSSSSTNAANRLTMTTFGELTTLDSADYDDVPSSDMMGQIFEGLYRVAANNKVELGMAAQEPKVSEDGLVYTFILRDAKWSDGSAVKAQDFVFTYRKLVNPQEGHVAQSADVFKNAKKIRSGELPVEELGVKALDDKTLEITLENPAPYLPKLLTGSRFLPQSEAVAQKLGDQYGSNVSNVVVNGPFKLEGWTGSELTWKLVKNADYWDASNVALNEVTVNVSKEVATSVQLFDSKQVQYTTISDQFVDQYKSQPTFHAQPKATMGYMNFNTLKPTTANQHFRRAIAMAYDKQALTNNVLKDGSIPSTGLIPKSFATNEVTGKDFVDESGDFLKFDVQEAQKEWELAKKELGVSEVTVTLLTSDTGTSKFVGEYLQAQIQKNLPGVTFKLQPVPLKNRLELQRASDYDIFYGTWAPDYQDPLNFLEQYITGGGINFGKYSNPEYDKAVDTVKSTYATQPENRWNQMLAAEKIIMNDAVVAPIYQASQSYLLAENVKGFEVLPFGRTVNLRQASVQ